MPESVTVATFVSDEVYENAPNEFVVGFVIENWPLLTNDTSEIAKFERDGVFLLIVNNVVVFPDK